MRLKKTATPVAPEAYSGYLDDCQRSGCQLPFTAPLPDMGYLQAYVDFGLYKPIAVTFYVQDTCNSSHQEQVLPSNYIVGQTPEGNWYGVFKYFNDTAVPVTNFALWLDVFVNTPAGIVEQTYFSEHMCIEPCQPLKKIKACQPELSTTTGFDVNGLYYGLPVNLDYLGLAGVRYFHIAYVRLAKARELAPKATFSASLTRNFRTTVERSWILETELTPSWYKDELLAIYARGQIEFDGEQFLVSDLAFEALNDDDLIWKPFAQLKETSRLYFGCDDSECVECCSPQVLSATSTIPDESISDSDSGSGGPCEPLDLGSNTSAPDGAVGVPYSYHLNLTGTPPYVITTVNAKPSWMTITPDGTGLQYSGTPDAPGTTIDVSVNLENDCSTLLGVEFFIDVTA